jgi:Uma2 family endonuclease
MDTSRQHTEDGSMVNSVGDMEATHVQHSITVEEFDRMAAAGVFRDLRVELIDGRLIDVPPQGPPHAGTLTACQITEQTALGRRAMVRQQMSLPVARDSQPEPDLALVRWADQYYRDRHPSAAETFAVVEVAVSSLSFDRGVKRRLYGAAGIPEYWIVDVAGKAVEIHRDPHDLGYGSHAVHKPGEPVSFAAFPDVVFAVDELVG